MPPHTNKPDTSHVSSRPTIYYRTPSTSTTQHT
jgi:hypothetical protein